MPRKGQTWTPEMRAKVAAAKAAKAGVAVNEPAPAADPPVRQRVPLQSPPPKPSCARWQMKAGNDRWEDGNLAWGDDNAASELQISKDLIPEGITLQWVTDSVYGDSQSFAQRRAGFEKTGWIPVHPEDFDGRFDGMFAPKGSKGEINKGGLVLMAKPTEMAMKAKKADERRAKYQVQLKEQALYGGELPGVMGADHTSAKRFNHVNRSVEKIAIPTDD